jgi:hypothetical protein
MVPVLGTFVRRLFLALEMRESTKLWLEQQSPDVCIQVSSVLFQAFWNGSATKSKVLMDINRTLASILVYYLVEHDIPHHPFEPLL